MLSKKSTLPSSYINPTVLRAVWIYSIVVSIPVILIVIPLFLKLLDPSLLNILTPVLMWLPALSAFIVLKKVVRPRSIREYLAISPIPSVPKLLLQIFGVLIGTGLLVFLTLWISDLLGFIQIDVTEWKGYLEMNPSVLPADAASQVKQTLFQLPLYILIFFILSTGEELGWRGFLHTSLIPTGFWKTSFTIALFWSIWHLPVILVSSYLGIMPIRDAIVVPINLFITSIILSGLRHRTGLVWPAVMGHAMLNTVVLFGFSAFKVPFDSSDQFSFWGFTAVNWIVWILALAFILIGTSRKRNQPIDV